LKEGTWFIQNHTSSVHISSSTLLSLTGQHFMAQPDHSVLRTPVFELDNMATQLPSLTESLLFVETESKHSLPIWTLKATAGRSLSFLHTEVNVMTFTLLIAVMNHFQHTTLIICFCIEIKCIHCHAL